MAILSVIGEQLEVVLGEAQTTALQWAAWYRDTDVNGRTSKPQVVHGLTNGTTAVALYVGPASGQRQLISLSCKNVDNVAHAIKVQVNNTGTSTVYQLVNEPASQNISVNGSLLYNEKRGWYSWGADGTKFVTAQLPLKYTYGTVPDLSLIIGGDTAAPGEFLTNSAAGTLTNIKALRVGSGPPPLSLGNLGEYYMDPNGPNGVDIYYNQ